MTPRFFISLIAIALLCTQPTIFAVDESDISLHNLKSVYKKGEVMNFSLEFPEVCGENVVAVEEENSGARVWEWKFNIGCYNGNESLERKQTQHITTEPAIPGGTDIHADPIISNNEGNFRFVYESNEIVKVWPYQVFEKMPLHLDTEAHMRITILVLFYIALPLYLYKNEIAKKFRK